MGYFRIGEDWDGLAGLNGGFGAAAQPLAVRRSIPVGSIVPTLRARRPAVVRPLTAQKAAIALAAQRRTISRLRSIRALPAQQLVAKVKALGRIDPQAFGGLGNLGAAVDSMVNMSGQLADVYEEAMSIPQATQGALGGTMLGQRVGDIAGALGVDVSWQDVLNNAGREFTRLYPSLTALGNAGDIMSLVGFQHIAAVFKDQQLGIGDLQNLAGTARGLYDTLASSGGLDAFTNIVSDAAAFGEGGLRQLVEGALGPGTDRWLTGANLQRLGTVAKGWIGAASSGSASGYVSAVGGTIAAVGTGLAAASVAVPVGTIIAAVGALVTLLAVLLGDEEPPPPPPVLPCSSVGYGLNPEAWTALSMWLVAKTGFFESPYFTEAERTGRLIQEIVQEEQWLANFDPYTGEVMVREPVAPGVQKPMRRLLDVMDRNVLLPSGDMDAYLSVFERMRPQFGMTPAKQRTGGWMWCTAAKEETLTRFLGANQYRVRGNEWGDNKAGTGAFRYDPEGTNLNPQAYIGSGFGWERWVSNDFFWRGYMRTMVISMYLGGTVPYGARGSDMYHEQKAVWFSTGVGGSAEQYPIEIRMPCYGRDHVHGGCTMPSPFGIWIPDHGKSQPGFADGVEIPFEELPSRLADQEWRLEHRVPMPSPDVQSQPSSEIVRPRGSPQRCTASGICMRMEMREIRSGAVFKRDEPSTGMGRGAKIALAVSGGIVVVGGGYLVGRHLRRRG